MCLSRYVLGETVDVKDYAFIRGTFRCWPVVSFEPQRITMLVLNYHLYYIIFRPFQLPKPNKLRILIIFRQCFVHQLNLLLREIFKRLT